MSKKAIIVGASGLIGSSLLNMLLAEPAYTEILILVRKRLPIDHQKLTQQVIDFDQLTDATPLISGHALFCCLGSTKSKTPDLAAYRKIDHDYPLLLAQLALKNNVKQYHLVSALGADAASSNFYTRMKGETEADIQHLALPCLHIYRPSLLTGNRHEKRIMERIAIGLFNLINPLLIGRLKKYRSIPADTVARAMLKQSLINQDGVFIHLSNQIKNIA